MTRNTKTFLAAEVLVLGCVIVAVVLLLGAVSIPSMSDQLVEDANRAVVTVVYPPADSTWPLNTYVPIRVMARAAQPIVQVELFINNTPLQARQGVVTTWAGQWDWQPGTAGDFILTARLTAGAGAISLSSPVRIHVDEAASSSAAVPAREGETLSGIAQAQGVDLGSLQSLNPDIDPQAGLEPGQPIFIPQDAEPVVNPQLIQPLESSEWVEPPAPASPADEGEEPGPGSSANLIDNFQFLQHMNAVQQEPQPTTEDNGTQGNGTEDNGTQDNGGNTPAQNGLPTAPELTGSIYNCEVKLALMGYYTQEDEDGFFIYRSRNGGDFERIQTLPPVKTADDYKNFTVMDPQQYGDVTYYAAAFNVLGEAASKPVTFPLGGTNCQPPANAENASQISLQDGNLVLPNNMDLAYMYLQINGSKAQRVPEGDRFFQPGSGLTFNLLKYIDSMSTELPASDLQLHMEVWGWSGAQLVYVGEFDTSIHRTVLQICSVPGPGNCASSTWGKWISLVDLPKGDVLKMLEYDVRWQVSSLATANHMHYTLAATPFRSEKANDAGNVLWAEGMSVSGTEGTFVLPLGHILYPDPPHPVQELGPGKTTQTLFDMTTNGFLGQDTWQPFTLYLRASAGLTPTGLSDVSNVIVLSPEQPALPSELPPLASPYSSVYDIEILEDTYSAPGFADPTMWGCVQVEYDPSGNLHKGDITCPGKEPPKDDCAGMSDVECLLLGMLDQLGWVYDQFIFLYEELKEVIIEFIWATTPYCKEIPASICTEAVHQGVDYVAEYYTGIPNDAPSSDELIADSAAKIIMNALIEGEEYFTEQDFSVIEQACREELGDCEKKMSDEIKVQIKKNRSYKAQVACWSGPETLIHGQKQACLKPDIIVHAAPGAMNVPAMVLVRVTRKDTPEAAAALASDSDKYRVMVSVKATGTYENGGQPFDEPLYETALVPIPWLKPGESAVVPATLKLLGEGGGLTKLLYFGSSSHMKAVEACYSPDSTWEWVPCLQGGQDSWDFLNQGSIGQLLSGIAEDASEEVETP